MATTYEEISKLSACLKNCWDVIERYADIPEIKLHVENLAPIVASPHNLQNLGSALDCIFQGLSAAIDQSSLPSGPSAYYKLDIADAPNKNITTGIYRGGNLTSLIDATSLKNYYLTEINLPGLTSIGALTGYARLTSINLPDLVDASTTKFGGCSALTEIELNSVSAAAAYMFTPTASSNHVYHTSLQKLTMNSLIEVKSGFCQNCVKLSSVSLPSATSLGKVAFSNTALTDVAFPNVVTIDEGCFAQSSALLKISLPKLTSIKSISDVSDGSQSPFYQTSLSSISMPSI